MIHINLREYAPADYVLSASQHDRLLREADTLSLSIERVVDTDRSYRVSARQTVGAVEIGDLSVLIEPKIGIPRLLSLACYAMGQFKPRQDIFDFQEREELPDVLARALASEAHRAFARGLLHGYRVEEDALQAVRGRIRIGDQIRRRPGFMLPVEVRYDDFTDDILENRLVKAAATRLSRMRLRSQKARSDLSWVAGMLEQVSLVEFGAGEVPEARFDRLNEHYRGVVGLARLVLRHSAFGSDRGQVRASGFLMDMNKLFQEFVTVALRELLDVSEEELRSDRRLPKVTLDTDGLAGLEPDLSWWDGTTCTFVGDAKYKNLTGKSVPGADLYQLLAYVTALDLPGGLLVYAQGEADTTSYLVRHSGKRLEVVALDLSGTLDEVLERVRYVAERVEALREHAARTRHAA